MPQPGEPLWTDEDRAWALALHAEEAEECPGCGLPMDETRSPDAEGEYVATRARCHACTPKERQKRIDADTDPGLYIGVTKRR